MVSCTIFKIVLESKQCLLGWFPSAVKQKLWFMCWFCCYMSHLTAEHNHTININHQSNNQNMLDIILNKSLISNIFRLREWKLLQKQRERICPMCKLIFVWMLPNFIFIFTLTYLYLNVVKCNCIHCSMYLQQSIKY